MAAVFKRYAPAWVILAVVVGLLLLRPWDSEPRGVVSEQPTPQTTVRGAAPDAPVQRPGKVAVEKAVAKKTKVSEQERERYRRAIRQAIAGRTKPGSSPAPKRAAPEQDDTVGGGGGLKDRSGGKLAGLMKDLQDDVMPLADECYEQAQERVPALAGALNLRFEILGDEDVGGLVESVDLAEGSDITDVEMIECMRETLLSTIFPAPDDSGSTAVELSLRFAPEEPE